MASKNDATGTEYLGVKLKEGMKDRITAIAEKHGLTQSEVVRRFLEAGIEANPLSENEVAKMRATRARRGQGLVIPLAPVASATPAPVTEAADENMEKMGIEPLRVSARATLKRAA